MLAKGFYLRGKKMLRKNFVHKIILLFLLVLISNISQASFWNDDLSKDSQNPLYFGGTVGYGSTNWDALVDKHAETDGSDISTPVSVTDKGAVWSVLAGYEFSPHFALQGNFQHYPEARIYFDEYSYYYPIMEMKSHTDAWSLISKFMVPLWHTGFRAFADMGPAYVYRQDEMRDIGRWAATFGGGFNYDLTAHIMPEINFTYITGNGKSDTQPVKSYMPFLYSVNVGLVFRLGWG